jgi:hypothetical protein
VVVAMSVFSNSGSSVYWNNPDSNFGFNNNGYGCSPLRNNNAFPLVSNYNNIGINGIGYGGIGYGGIGYGGIGINNFALMGMPFIGGGFLGY